MVAMLNGVTLGCAVDALLVDSVEAMLDGITLRCTIAALMGDSVVAMRCWMASSWAAQSVRYW